MSDIPDMVERVARALVPDAWHETKYPDGSKRFTLVLWEEEQARARKLARIALQTAREPTEAMCKANYTGPIYGGVDDGWRLMIDAVLAEQSS